MRSMRLNFHYETFGRKVGVTTGAWDCRARAYWVAGRWIGSISSGGLITPLGLGRVGVLLAFSAAMVT